MSLHLVKLCVGVNELSEMEFWASEARAGRDNSDHVTRAYPKRESEILPGGSLYWVIRGMILCRQPIAAFEKVQTYDGIMRCRIVFEPTIIAVRPRPRRAFQGWRYLEAFDTPPDLSTTSTLDATMPEQMRRDLAALGLL